MNLRDVLGAADPVSRRAFLSGLAKSAFGVAALPALPQRLLAPRAGDEPIPLRPATSRQVIYLFLRGGLSHLDTFDPKPGTPGAGPVQAIATKALGVQLSQYLPELAKVADRIAVVNALSSTQGAHAQAQYFLRTSYELRGTIQHPGLGVWANRMGGKLNPMLPGHVVIGGGPDLAASGWMPPQYLPLPIGDAKTGLLHGERPAGVSETQFVRRLELLRKMNEGFANRYDHKGVRAYGDMYAEAVRLMRSADLAAFDVDLEPASIRAGYGDSAFGQGCLLARRLVEHEVRYIEVVSDGWDTHNQNFDQLEEKLPEIDRALAALIADLDARGLLHETLVVLATEFGRTPDIVQENNGRNHYPKAFSALLAGGGVRGGIRWGRTDATGHEVVEGRMTVPDFNATIAHALGLPVEHVLHAPSGRPFTVADKGRPVLGLFA